MKYAQPLSVSYCTEVSDNVGHYIGETYVIVEVKGNCCPRAFLGGRPAVPPRAWGGIIYHISYMSDTDVSIVEYRFRNGLFKNRFRSSERFRKKILTIINTEKIKQYKQQIGKEK